VKFVRHRIAGLINMQMATRSSVRSFMTWWAGDRIGGGGALTVANSYPGYVRPFAYQLATRNLISDRECQLPAASAVPL
jgi:hypothetical protein